MASNISFKKVFKTVIWPRKNTLLLGLLLIFISRMSSLVLPGSIKLLIDDAIGKGDNRLFWLIIIAVGVAITVQSLTSFLLVRLVGIEAHRIIAKLRVEVQKKVLSLPVSFFDKNKSGTLVSRIMNDVDGIRNLIGTGLIQLIGGSLTSLVTLGILIYISPKLTMYVFVPVILMGIIFFKAFSYIRPVFRQRRDVNAKVQGRLTETIGGIRIIKGYGAEQQEQEVFEEGVNTIFSFVKKSMTAQALVTSGTTFIMGITVATIMAIGGSMIVDEQFTVGKLISYAAFLVYLIAPIVQMGNIGTQLTDAFSGLDRTEELMNMTAEADTEERTIELEKIDGHLVFDDVSFTYEEGKEVLKHVSFETKPGTVTALVGTSGAGKSTIAGLVATHLVPDSGVVSMDEHDLSKVTLTSYRRHLGMVLQDDFLFEGTIRENILFPRPNSTEEELDRAVKAAYVHEFTDRFEEGLDTVVGERGVKLSGGQKQRVSIARAILANPKVLILDEATSSLDVESEMLIQESLANLINGRTTIVIAHRLSTIRQADQILVVEQGEIIERGTHDELIEKKGKYNDLFTLQARI